MVGLTVATAVLVLLHDPPAVPLVVNVVIVPTAIGEVPEMTPAVTAGLIVTVNAELTVPLQLAALLLTIIVAL